MTSGRVFQSLGPATANDRSLTVTSRDGGMTSSEEVDDRGVMFRGIRLKYRNVSLATERCGSAVDVIIAVGARDPGT